MELSPVEARVLACLIEKETGTADQYPLTLNALRLACNQTSNRTPVVAYDDRAVEAALLQLKATGLVRFVLPHGGGRTTRYRHCADERWKLSAAELAVLAVLVLRGEQTVAEVRSRVSPVTVPASISVPEVLDTLAARSPEGLAERLPTRPGEREPRWRHSLSAYPDGSDASSVAAGSSASGAATSAATSPLAGAADIATEVAELRARVTELERVVAELDGRITWGEG